MGRPNAMCPEAETLRQAVMMARGRQREFQRCWNHSLKRGQPEWRFDFAAQEARETERTAYSSLLQHLQEHGCDPEAFPKRAPAE